MGRKHGIPEKIFAEQWLVPVGLAVIFLLGGILGFFLASAPVDPGAEALREYLTGYLDTVRSGEPWDPGLLDMLWDYFRFPAAAFLLGLTALGVIGYPILFFARGFLLSFTITAFIWCFGTDGAWVMFITAGIAELICLPVLFLLATRGMPAALSLLYRAYKGSGTPRLTDRRYWILGIGCAVVLAVCASVHTALIPIVLPGLF